MLQNHNMGGWSNGRSPNPEFWRGAVDTTRCDSTMHYVDDHGSLGYVVHPTHTHWLGTISAIEWYLQAQGGSFCQRRNGLCRPVSTFSYLSGLGRPRGCHGAGALAETNQPAPQACKQVRLTPALCCRPEGYRLGRDRVGGGRGSIGAAGPVSILPGAAFSAFLTVNSQAVRRGKTFPTPLSPSHSGALHWG